MQVSNKYHNFRASETNNGQRKYIKHCQKAEKLISVHAHQTQDDAENRQSASETMPNICIEVAIILRHNRILCDDFININYKPTAEC